MANPPSIWPGYLRAGYDLAAGHAAYRRLVGLQIQALRLRHGMRILDLGCGSGLFMVMLKALKWRCHVIGIDSTPVMVAAARAKAGVYALYGGSADIYQGDLNGPLANWGLPPGFKPVERGFCNNVAYALKHPERFLETAAPLFVPGALLSLSTPMPNPSMAAIHAEHARLAVPQPGPEQDAALAEITQRLSVLEKHHQELTSNPAHHFVDWRTVLTWIGPEWDLVGYRQLYGDPPQSHVLLLRRTDHGSQP